MAQRVADAAVVRRVVYRSAAIDPERRLAAAVLKLRSSRSTFALTGRRQSDAGGQE